jgi:hypothetical protein
MFISLRRWDEPRQETPAIRMRSTRQLGKTAASATTPTAAPPSPATSPSPAGDTAANAQLAARAALAQALGASVRCAHPDAFKMDGAERERCQRAASQLARGGPAYAALPADPAKAAAFERAARLNEAWRQYQGSSSKNDYPGLLTLFGHDAEPCPPGDADDPGLPKCWRRIP